MPNTSKPLTPAPKTLDSLIITTLITAIGSIVCAFITTRGVIASNGKGIQDNAQKLSELSQQAASLQKPGLPIGTVIASLLTPPEFAEAAGDPKDFDLKTSKWTLADGKSVSGTGWAILRGNAPVPDLGGVFLRGKKNGSKREEMKSVSEIELGIFQQDKVGPHQHAIRVSDPKGTTDVQPAGLRYEGGPFTFGTDRMVAAWNDGPETLPKNITVNYYIRINN